MERSNEEIRKIAEDIAYKLNGTSKFLQTILEEHDLEGLDDNSTFCYFLDQQVFCCERCDWWFAQSEMAEEEKTGGRWICEECADDE